MDEKSIVENIEKVSSDMDSVVYEYYHSDRVKFMTNDMMMPSNCENAYLSHHSIIDKPGYMRSSKLVPIDVIYVDGRCLFTDDISVFDNDPFGAVAKYPSIIDICVGNPRYDLCVAEKDNNPYTLADFLVDSNFDVYDIEKHNVNACTPSFFADKMIEYLKMANEETMSEIIRWIRESVVACLNKTRKN